MITEDKVTELFCMADDFCKFFDRMVAKYTFKSTVKRSYHRIDLWMYLSGDYFAVSAERTKRKPI